MLRYHSPYVRRHKWLLITHLHVLLKCWVPLALFQHLLCSAYAYRQLHLYLCITIWSQIASHRRNRAQIIIEVKENVIVCSVGPNREGVACIRSQVQWPMWSCGRGLQGSVTSIHAVHWLHLAISTTFSSHIPVQWKIFTYTAWPCSVLSVWYFHWQLWEGSRWP